MAGTAAAIVAKAASQIGTKESPANSNRQKYGEWYGMNGEPWCDMFVSWCAAQTGSADVVGKFAYTPSHAAWFKNKGMWLGRVSNPQPGDIVFFANSSRICHVGIVEKRLGATQVQTIEGNTSLSGSQSNGGMVCRKTRSLGALGSSWHIAGYARPKYAKGASSTASTPKASSAGKLAVSGKMDAASVKALQKLLGTTADGVLSHQTTATKKHHQAFASGTIHYDGTRKGSDAVRALQRKLGVAADGLLGANTVKAYQRKLGVTADGYWGPNTTKAVQRALNAGKLW